MSLSLEQQQDYRRQVWTAAKDIYNAGLVSFGEGNVSMRVGKKEECFMTPTQNDYATLTPEEIVYMGFDGAQYSQGRPASSEYRLHVTLYQARPKLKCVIHTHSPYAAMLSVMKKKIPVLLEEMLVFLGGEVQVAEYGQAGTDQLGKNAINAMGETNAVLMTNHAVVVCGKDMPTAVRNARLVEKMALIYWGALMGNSVHSIDPQYWPKFQEYYRSLYSTASKKTNEN